MKRKERHHLKHNPVADVVLRAQRFVDTNARLITTAVIIVAVAAIAAAGIFLVRQQTAVRSDALLAEAMVALNAEVLPGGARGEGNVPAAAQFGAEGAFATEEAKLNAALPKLRTAADTYPNTQGAIVARYHLAAALAALGRHDEALTEFDDVIRRAGRRGLYGRMARLGKADTLVQSGQYDEAIALWQDAADRRDDLLPPDAILMELARVYVAKGDTDEARRALSEIVDQHPESIYAGEARSRLNSLEG